MRIYGSLEETVGNTPIVRLCKIEKYLDIVPSLYAKLEGRNPSGSVKDRTAAFMLKGVGVGEKIVTATSGNLGISLACLSAARGITATVVMPASASYERRKIIKASGAELILCDGGMGEATERARQYAERVGGRFLSQFDSLDNPLAHKMTTAPEIERDMKAPPDFIVLGVGSGGTITGIGEYFKPRYPSVKMVAVEPSESPVLSGGVASSHRIEGLGAGFLPTILNKKLLSEVITVDYEEALEGQKILARLEGILGGISSGAALWASVRVAKRKEGKSILTLLPDGMERYLSRL